MEWLPVNTFHHLEGFLFHKKPQLPTFFHVAHYKWGLGKVKRAGSKKAGKNPGKTGNWRGLCREEYKWQALKKQLIQQKQGNRAQT